MTTRPEWMYAENGYRYFVRYQSSDSSSDMKESSAIAEVAGGLAYQVLRQHGFGGGYDYEIVPWSKVWLVEHKRIT